MNVYEKTISYYLKSILDQTSQDFEIIVINDGSKDGFQKVGNSYLKRYPEKLRLYRLNNIRVGITRNRRTYYANTSPLVWEASNVF